jgi:hypothetical protein
MESTLEKELNEQTDEIDTLEPVRELLEELLSKVGRVIR